MMRGVHYRPVYLGRTERIIQVKPGVTQSYVLTLDLAGRLRIVLKGSPTDEDLLVTKYDRFVGQVSTWGPGLDHDRVCAFPWEPDSVAKMTLYRKGMLPLPVRHIVSEPSPMVSVCNRWPFDRELLTEYIPLGDYSLVTELAGGRRIEQNVTIESGGITDVRVDVPDQ